MRRLKIRTLPHTMDNQVRRHSATWTRIAYLALLGAIALWLLDLLFGSSLFLKSEGMVLAPSATIATEYPATVRAIEVKEGDQVQKGHLVARISSQSVNESIARLTTEMATLRARESELRIQSERNESLSRLAGYRSQVATETRARYETLQKRGILPADKRTAAIDSEYKSQYDAEALKAETDAITEQLLRLEPAIDRAEQTLSDLEKTYGRGELTSPLDGIVGRRYVEPGSVIRPGEPIADVYTRDTYVLAYLPTGTLYEVEPGQKVIIRWGVKAIPGRIRTVEPLAVALPKEFQTSFKPVARNQILRIEFDEPADAASRPPLFAKVQVRGTSLLATVFGWVF
ncbi:MAG: HlyD family efflux transporter periplasmic adaptor subunit [Rhodospirillaceae bacterium]|nr:HlyD family efflux transporter periplasmic adaptor subunit [Rhodospirillaceae bacterium]